MTIFTAVLSFIGTNLDDFILLMLLHTQAGDTRGKLKILCGQYLGIFALVLLSVIARFGLVLIPREYIRFLGLIPMILGIRGFLQNEQDGEDSPVSAGILAVAMLTIAGGGDNLGVYIPMFAALSVRELLITVVVFAIMIPLWNMTAGLASQIPVIKTFVQRYKRCLLPAVLILLGVIILLSV